MLFSYWLRYSILSLLFTTKFFSECQFKNHIELFSTFLNERRYSEMWNLKKKTDKIHFIQFQLFIFCKLACLEKNFHGRLQSFQGGKSRISALIHPGIFLGRTLWADSVSPRMNTISSQDRFRPIRIRENLVVSYRVIETRVEVWENEKCCGNTNRRRVFPQLFHVNSIETRSTGFTCYLWLSECKFSLLMPSLRQQRALVLCLHQVIQTRFLTNQHGCFLGVFKVSVKRI